jgi:hypothetical protein
MGKVVIPTIMDSQMIHHAVSRNVKHISVIACVSDVGESLTPYITKSQNSSLVQEQPRKHGVRFRRDLILKSNHRPYVNTEIFLDYIKTVFLSYLVWLRGLDEFAIKGAILLMDNYSDHVTDHVIRLLTEGRVRVITLHQIQLRSFRSLT